MRAANAALAAVFLLLPSFSWAERVRTLATTSREMPVVSLKTGRSTVLRFSSPPKKVVLGNQNYFNVEFIESDITLQPLGPATSNLFVYGDGFTYGFILKVNQGSNYDDLVFVKSKLIDSGEPETKRAVAKPKLKPDVNYEVITPKKAVLQIKGTPFKWHEPLKSYFSDIFLTFSGPSPAKMPSLQFVGAKGDISSIAPVFEEEVMTPGKKVRVRLFSALEARQGARIKVKIEGKDLQYEVKWKK